MMLRDDKHANLAGYGEGEKEIDGRRKGGYDEEYVRYETNNIAAITTTQRTGQHAHMLTSLFTHACMHTHASMHTRTHTHTLTHTPSKDPVFLCPCGNHLGLFGATGRRT